MIGGRLFATLLPLAVVAGCATLAGGTPVPRFENAAASAGPSASRQEWTAHLIRMQLGMFPEAGRLPEGHVLPDAAVDAGLAAAENAELAVTWIGHATVLIRIGGKWVLTDPALMNTIGVGPLRIGRMAPPRPSLDDLPPIDLILISHADYDHLDLPTLRRLAVRNPEAIVLVPEGTRRLMAPAGFRTVIEAPWYRRGDWDGIGIEAVPAIHGVRRPPEPPDNAHWVGWILDDGDRRLYFAGDTGFGPVFGDIRRRSGPVDYALVPIGAYEPRRLEGLFHVDPEQAAEIARIVGARIAIGMHWGTFPLSEEAPTEQRARFLAASGSGVVTRVPRVGETVVLLP